jgi:hypothetical protein
MLALAASADIRSATTSIASAALSSTRRSRAFDRDIAAHGLDGVHARRHFSGIRKLMRIASGRSLIRLRCSARGRYGPSSVPFAPRNAAATLDLGVSQQGERAISLDSMSREPAVQGTAVGLRLERGPILAALMLSTGLVAIDSTIIATAVPSIVRSVNGFADFPWLFSIYLLGQAVTVPVYGKTEPIPRQDRFSRHARAFSLLRPAAHLTPAVDRGLASDPGPAHLPTDHPRAWFRWRPTHAARGSRSPSRTSSMG